LTDRSISGGAAARRRGARPADARHAGCDAMEQEEPKMRIKRLQWIGVCLGTGVCLVAAAPAISPGPAGEAAACAMRPLPVMAPARAKELLVAAATAARAGELREARALAERVVDGRVRAPAMRAEALALVGWVDWQRNRRAVALRSFREAKSLDRSATILDRVLADVGPTKALADLRRALAA
jgi:hypothetical protein